MADQLLSQELRTVGTKVHNCVENFLEEGHLAVTELQAGPHTEQSLMQKPGSGDFCAHGNLPKHTQSFNYSPWSCNRRHLLALGINKATLRLEGWKTDKLISL